jgi:hypothetical protein
MAQKCWQWLRFVGNGQQDTWSHVLSLLRCPVTVDLPFCHWILLVRVFRHRKLLGSGLVSSYPAAPEALDLDLQTSNHRVHRRGTRLPPGQPNSRLSKIHWRILRDLTARTNPDPSPVRQLRFLAPGQGADAEEDHLSPDTCGRCCGCSGESCASLRWMGGLAGKTVGLWRQYSRSPRPG